MIVEEPFRNVDEIVASLNLEIVSSQLVNYLLHEVEGHDRVLAELAWVVAWLDQAYTLVRFNFVDAISFRVKDGHSASNDENFGSI